jgi:hypothetical protein
MHMKSQNTATKHCFDTESLCCHIYYLLLSMNKLHVFLCTTLNKKTVSVDIFLSHLCVVVWTLSLYVLLYICVCPVISGNSLFTVDKHNMTSQKYSSKPMVNIFERQTIIRMLGSERSVSKCSVIIKQIWRHTYISWRAWCWTFYNILTMNTTLLMIIYIYINI